MRTIRIRSAVWFVTGAVLALIASLLVLQAWRVDAGPGDSDATFEPMTACRLIDTRPAPDRVGPHGTLSQADTTTIQARGVNGKCTIPSRATALLMNVTALNATAGTFLTFWPGGAMPLAASLTPTAGEPAVPNAVTVPLSAAGAFNVYNNLGRVDIVIDVNGYYTKASLKQLDQQLDLINSGNAVIPSGMTVIGEVAWDNALVKDNDDNLFVVHFPAKAPVPLTFNKVNFAPATGVLDGDPNCTGTVTAPTAPPGKVCIYVDAAYRVDGLAGFEARRLTDRGFMVDFKANGVAGQDMYLYFTWAYTAP